MDCEKIVKKLAELADKNLYVDVENGEAYFGVDGDVYFKALLMLIKEGYHVQSVPLMRVGTKDMHFISVLCPKDAGPNAAYINRNEIRPLASFDLC